MEKNKKIGIIVAIVISVVFFSYLSTIAFSEIEQRKALEDVQISFHEATLQDIGFSGATLDLALEMYNPNDITATLDKADYDLWFNDNFLGHGLTHQRIDIPPFTSKIIHTEFDLDFTGAGKSIISALTQGEASWRLAGTAYYNTILGTLNIPFDITL
jgi:LEA14-like dessication related protein